MMRVREPGSVVTTYRIRSWGDMAGVTSRSGWTASAKSTEYGSVNAWAAFLKANAVLGLVGHGLLLVPFEVAVDERRHRADRSASRAGNSSGTSSTR